MPPKFTLAQSMQKALPPDPPRSPDGVQGTPATGGPGSSQAPGVGRQAPSVPGGTASLLPDNLATNLPRRRPQDPEAAMKAQDRRMKLPSSVATASTSQARAPEGGVDARQTAAPTAGTQGSSQLPAFFLDRGSRRNMRVVESKDKSALVFRSGDDTMAIPFKRQQEPATQAQPVAQPALQRMVSLNALKTDGRPYTPPQLSDLTRTALPEPPAPGMKKSASSQQLSTPSSDATVTRTPSNTSRKRDAGLPQPLTGMRDELSRSASSSPAPSGSRERPRRAPPSAMNALRRADQERAQPAAELPSITVADASPQVPSRPTLPSLPAFRGEASSQGNLDPARLDESLLTPGTVSSGSAPTPGTPATPAVAAEMQKSYPAMGGGRSSEPTPGSKAPVDAQRRSSISQEPEVLSIRPNRPSEAVQQTATETAREAAAEASSSVVAEQPSGPALRRKPSVLQQLKRQPSVLQRQIGQMTEDFSESVNFTSRQVMRAPQDYVRDNKLKRQHVLNASRQANGGKVSAAGYVKAEVAAILPNTVLKGIAAGRKLFKKNDDTFVSIDARNSDASATPAATDTPEDGPANT